MASIPRSLTALIYQERSLLEARKFVHIYFLSRQIDMKSMLKFRNPKTTLIELTKKFGRELPKSRYDIQKCILYCVFHVDNWDSKAIE